MPATGSSNETLTISTKRQVARERSEGGGEGGALTRQKIPLIVAPAATASRNEDSLYLRDTFKARLAEAA